MSIKKYIANKDTTITNALFSNFTQRAYDCNMGAADSLEIFSLYGQIDDSIEKSRVLVQFPVEDIKKDRENSKIPASGSVSFILRLYNVEHPFSLPKEFNAHIGIISSSWDEGYGLDMENYTDYGWSAAGKGVGATWKYSLSGNLWQNPGGDILEGDEYNFSYFFKNGTEDIELDVTQIVEKWIAEEVQNNGFLVKMSASFEDGSQKQSFYTKKFSARGSQFFFQRPCIEARWETVTKDDRNNFYVSSSTLSPEDNKMNIYFYHGVNGKLKNIVDNIVPSVKFYTNDVLTQEITSSYLNITNPLAGIYRAEVALNTSASAIYDVWYNTSSLQQYFKSSFDVYTRQHYDFNNKQEYVAHIVNNKHTYNNSEYVRFNIFVRESDWQPTIYKVAYNTIENTSLQDLYYKIFRLNDNYVVVDYSTGSVAYTKTSYDSNGNYFEIDMSIFEKNYNYGIKLARWDGIELSEFATTFKFKVE